MLTDLVSVERRNLFVDEKVLLLDELNFMAIFLQLSVLAR
jgi:hypothetical protein